MNSVPPTRPPEPRDGMSVLGVMNILLRYRRVIILTPLILMLLTFLVVRFRKRDFVSTATVTANTADSPSRVSGLAAQFGVALPGSTPGESPEFFRALLVSREILKQAALTEYRIRTGPEPTDSAAGTFIELANIEGDTDAAKVVAAIKELETRIRSSNDLTTNIITLTVRAPQADLAVKLNRRILQLADEYNSARRRSQARLEREFAEARSTEAKRTLEQAEAALRSFLEGNRGYAGSPSLMFEHQTLQRRVELSQQLYVSLAQAYEQARIDEVRDMPVLSVITPPETVVEPVAGGLVIRLLLALVGGVFLAVAYAFISVRLEYQRETEPGEYRTFVQLLRSAVRSPLGSFRARPAASIEPE